MTKAQWTRALLVAIGSAQLAGAAGAVVYPVNGTQWTSEFSTVFNGPIGTITNVHVPLDPGSLPLELQAFKAVSTRVIDIRLGPPPGNVISIAFTLTLPSGDTQFGTGQATNFTDHGDGTFTELGTFTFTGGTGSQAGVTGGGPYKVDGSWSVPARTAGTSITTLNGGVIVLPDLTPGLPGTSPQSPFLPQQQLPDGSFLINGGSGFWFDPPLANGYRYEMQGDSLFTSLEFAPGFADSMVLSSPSCVIAGTFGGGDVVDLAGLCGGGIAQFSVNGIDPAFDAADPNAFPVKLGFDTTTAEFAASPIPVPEPGTWAMLACGLALLGIAMHNRCCVALTSRAGSAEPDLCPCAPILQHAARFGPGRAVH